MFQNSPIQTISFNVRAPNRPTSKQFGVSAAEPQRFPPRLMSWDTWNEGRFPSRVTCFFSKEIQAAKKKLNNTHKKNRKIAPEGKVKTQSISGAG